MESGRTMVTGCRLVEDCLHCTTWEWYEEWDGEDDGPTAAESGVDVAPWEIDESAGRLSLRLVRNHDGRGCSFSLSFSPVCGCGENNNDRSLCKCPLSGLDPPPPGDNPSF